MTRRKGSIDRDALREKLVAVAEALVVQGGAQALTARALATHIGYSLGHVYNLVTDLDELVLLINARTLTHLLAEMEQAVSTAKGPDRLYRLAGTYLHFCKRNARLWELALSHRLEPDRDLPGEYGALIAALPELVARELRALYPRRHPDSIKKDVATLWAGLHGLVTLDQSGRLPLIGAPGADVLGRHLLDNYLTGLNAEKAS